MGYNTALGWTESGGSVLVGDGQPGQDGVSVVSITSVDNLDGSISLTFTMSDGSTQGPFVNTLVSDTLVNLSKLSLVGTNDSEKLLVKTNAGGETFKVDTTTNEVTAPVINTTALKNGQNLINMLAYDAQIGSHFRISVDSQPLYITAPSTVLNSPVSVFNNDTDRDIVFNVVGTDLTDSAIKISGKEGVEDFYNLIEPGKITTHRNNPVIDTWIELNATEVKTDQPLVVESQTSYSSPLIDMSEIFETHDGGFHLDFTFFDVNHTILFFSNVIIRPTTSTTYALSALETLIKDALTTAGFDPYLVFSLVPNPDNLKRVKFEITFLERAMGFASFFSDTGIDMGFVGVNSYTGFIQPGVAEEDLFGGETVTAFYPWPGSATYTMLGDTDVLTPHTASLTKDSLQFQESTVGTLTFGSDEFTLDKKLNGVDIQLSGDITSTTLTPSAKADITTLSTATEGDLYYAGSGGVLTKLAKPSVSGQVLGFDTGGLAPVWKTSFPDEISKVCQTSTTSTLSALSYHLGHGTGLTLAYGDASNWDLTTNYDFTASKAGIYQISTHVGFQNASALMQMDLRLNGVKKYTFFRDNTSDHGSTNVGKWSSGTVNILLNVGDVIYVSVFAAESSWQILADSCCDIMRISDITS